jgi:hypothetical protein
MSPVYHLVARLCRQDDRSDPIVIIDRLILWLAAMGWPEERVRLIEIHIRSRIDQAYAGSALVAPEAIDETEQRLDGAEDELQLRRLLKQTRGLNATAAEMLQEAGVREELAAVQVVHARSLRRGARRLGVGLGQRFSVFPSVIPSAGSGQESES